MKTKIIGKNKIKSIQAQSSELAVLMSEYATRDEVYAAFDKKSNADFGKIVDLTVCAAGNGTFTIESTNYQPVLVAISEDDIYKKDKERKIYGISCYEGIERVADTKKLYIDPEEVINKLIELLAKTVDLQTVCRISDKSLQEIRLRGNGFLSQCHRVSKADYVSFTGDIYDEKDNSRQSSWVQGKEKSDKEKSDRDKMQTLKKNVMLCKIKIASGDTVDTQDIENELNSRYKKYGGARDEIAKISPYTHKILCDIENKKRLYMGVRIKEKELDALAPSPEKNEEIRRRCISLSAPPGKNEEIILRLILRLSIIDRCRKCIRKSDITVARTWPDDKGEFALVEKAEKFIEQCKSEADKEEVKQEFSRAVGKSKTLMRLFWLSASVIAVIAAAIVNIVALQ